jgi:ATP-dependent Lon protease
MIAPLFVGRLKSINALELVMEENKQIVLLTQKKPSVEDPKQKDLFKVGTLGNILQMLKLPDGTVKVLVEGKSRCIIEKVNSSDEYTNAKLKFLKDEEFVFDNKDILTNKLSGVFEQYAKLNGKINSDILSTISEISDPSTLTDTIVNHLLLNIEEKQEFLEMMNPMERTEKLTLKLESEIEILSTERKIRNRVKKQMEKSQREYYLNEQVKAIQKELGDSDEGAEFDELQDKINNTEMSTDAKEKCVSELKKLKMMSPMSAEASVVRTYIETIVNLPWSKSTKINHDLSSAEITLDNDHYGLDKVKERIIEYLAVQQRVDKLKAPILCLVGPPGVGKTSLGQSIAKAINRKFIRMALGGVRDEAEIRGHRRTYIGSMPGKILQNMTKAGVTNPLFLLDEVDKMGQDFRGDPSSALLEVLDPEQNHTFNDHYAEIEYDLSNVMFVATANSMNIPEPLLDRMEIIRLPGYTEAEKANIANKHLLPKQLTAHGLKKSEVKITPKAIKDIIQYYSREAGVRKLEQEISKICRKVVKKLLTNKKIKNITISNKNIQEFLGVKIFDIGLANKKNQIGQVTGLAWTQVGGELLTIETVVVPGKGKTIITGKLGDVMQESIHAAMSVVRSRADILGIDKDFYETKDIHIHFPEGATPKDGPSAGIGITTAIISSLTNIPVFNDVAMTGEITLRGEVLAIGGLKEKLLAAHRGNLKKILIPEQNLKDLVDIPPDVKNALKIIPVRWIDQVIELALTKQPSKNKAGAKSGHGPQKKFVEMNKPTAH